MQRRLLTGPTNSDSAHQDSPASALQQEEPTSSSSGRVVPALTDNRCKAEVVPLNAVLTPG